MPPLPVALPDNDPPPPPTQMVGGISLPNHPGLSLPLLPLHFLTSSASISPSLSKLQFLTGEMVAGNPKPTAPTTPPPHFRPSLSSHSNCTTERLTSPPFSLKFLSLEGHLT